MHPVKIFFSILGCLIWPCLFFASGFALEPGKEQSSITVVSDDNYPPYIFRGAKGEIQGILVDEWALWQKKTGIRAVLVAMDWSKAQEFMAKGQADVIDTIFFNEKRAELYDFTRPYTEIDVPVFFHKNIGGIVSLESLQGLTIGVKSGDACIDVLNKSGITTLKEFNSYEAVIMAAVEGRIKVFSVDKPPALYYLYKLNAENEFRYSMNLYTGEFHRAVKKGRSDLLKQVEDGFALISKKEHEAINRKWMGEPLIRQDYIRIVAFFFLFAGILFAGLAGFNLILRKRVRVKTKALQSAMEDLRLGEERYRMLAEHSLQGIALLKGNPPVFVYVNPRWVEIFGYEADEALSMGPEKMWNLVHPDDREMVRQRNRDRITGKPAQPMYDFRIIRKSGEVRWVEVFANRMENEKEPSSQAVYIDITDRKLAEEALKKSEENYRLLIENQTDMIVKVDLEGRFLFVSPSYCRVFGKTESELIGQTFMPLVHEDDREPTAKKMKKLFSPPHSVYLEQRAMTKDGWKWLGWMDTAVLDENGNLKEIIGVGRDITEARQAEKEKLEAQKNAVEHEKYALVGRIAGKMAHDFNNILGAVMGNAELALIDCSHAPIQKKLRLILDQTLRGKNLTRNLVAFAKDQEPKQEFFAMDEKMDLVLALMRKDLEGVSITRQYVHGLPKLLADPGMIEHAAVNLVQNAIHATSLVREPCIIVRTFLRNNRIGLEIEDNGCGIPASHIQDIFEPSFTLKGSRDTTGSYQPGIKGTGYGMANVKKYITLHKGDIEVYSEVNKGTRIVMTFPVIKKELTPEEIERVEKEPVCSGKYILLVEDEPAIADVQYSILTNEPLNHRVDIAPNGKTAMDLLDRNQYDLISLDYILPGGITGMDVYHHARKINGALPILFVSGNIEFLESISDLKHKDPFVDHLSKPSRNVDYIYSISKLLDIV